MKFEDWSADAIAKGQKKGEWARGEVDSTLASLHELLGSRDAVEILARMSLELIARIAQMNKEPMKEGLEVFHVELLQALALSAPRRQALPDDDYAGLAAKLAKLVERNGQAYRHRWLLKLGADAKANRRHELIAALQDWTLAIRGPRHIRQTRAYLAGLSTLIAPTFRPVFSCEPQAFADALSGIIDLIDRKFQDHHAWMGSWMRKKSGIAMIDAFAARLPPDDAGSLRAQALPRRHEKKFLQFNLISIAERMLAPILTFTIDELLPADQPDRAALAELIDGIALGFGEVTSAELDHLHLSNPVRLKPLIRLGDGHYMCCNPHSLGTNLAEIFEAVCLHKLATKKRLEKARAVWLEDELARLAATHLPSAAIHRSVKWIDPADGRGYETDVIAVIDKTLIVFEAKSGKIEEAAKRGAINSLKEALETVVLGPSIQSARFKTLVETATSPLRFKTQEGELHIDGGALRSVIRVNVVLEPVGPLSAQWPMLKETGLVPSAADIAPTMSVFELETIFEVLKLEVERCHYLSRRVLFERDTRYVADELDLLAFYLETQFNIEPTEGLFLYGKSAPLALAYTSLGPGDPIDLPIKRTALWDSLLKQVETLRPVGWTRFGHRLLNFPYAAQKKFGGYVSEGQRNIRQSPGHFFTSSVVTNKTEQNTIGLVVATDDGPEQFQQNLAYGADSAFEHGEAAEILMILQYSPPTGNAYDFIGVMKRRPAGSWLNPYSA